MTTYKIGRLYFVEHRGDTRLARYSFTACGFIFASGRFIHESQAKNVREAIVLDPEAAAVKGFVKAWADEGDYPTVHLANQIRAQITSAEPPS